jgi:hypothetical protein
VRRLAALLCILFTGLSLGIAQATDLSVSSEPYFTSGLFTDPLIARVGDTVTVTVRATVEGAISQPVAVRLTVTSPEGLSQDHLLQLTTEGATAAGSVRFATPRSGEYLLQAQLDPAGAIAETNEANNSASLVLPVVVPGRLPQFAWWYEHTNLRWMSLLAGGMEEKDIPQWAERGVKALAWRYGNNYPNDADQDTYRQMYSGFSGRPGIAVDECGYYPDDLPKVRQFEDCLLGMAQAKRGNPDKVFFVWHAGELHPAQTVLYRDAIDLLALETYVFHYCRTDSIYKLIDRRMAAADAAGLLNASGRGPQAFATLDLYAGGFDRGRLEAVVRHVRRTWPEMRNFGYFGILKTGKQTEQQAARADADERFADQLCYDYFVRGVVTLAPASVTASSPLRGRQSIQAVVSNIGGMDSGPVLVGLYADDRLIATRRFEHVPAADSAAASQVVASAQWRPAGGAPKYAARILAAKGCTVLDAIRTAK